METRSKKSREISPCSSSNIEKKRKLSRKKMAIRLNGAQDIEFLLTLESVCTGKETIIGKSFTWAWWERFAILFSRKIGTSISTEDCIETARHHHMLYNSYEKVLPSLNHPVMKAADYQRALKTIYAKSRRVIPKYPLESGEGSGGPIRTSRSGQTSRGSYSSGPMGRSINSDDWNEWEPRLYDALAALHSANLVTVAEVELVSAQFRRSTTRIGLRLFLGKHQLQFIKDMLANPPFV